MRRLFLLLLRWHGLYGSAHALWTEGVYHAEKMQDYPLWVLGGWVGAIPPRYPAHEEMSGNATRLVPTQRKCVFC
jgi:hypothetical protein